jgi:hypothetical protein
MTHIAMTGSEIPHGLSAISDETRFHSPDRPPVFLHCGWRTRGTWIWNRFRRMRAVAGFYEPLGETIGELRAGTLADITADSWPSGHTGLERPYFDEYRPLLRTGRPGVRGYRARFATSGFFAEPDCGSSGRIDWMRRHFPDAVHIVVLRDPFEQYASSAQKFAANGLGYFLGRPLLLLALNRDLPLVGRAIRHLGVELPDFSKCGSTQSKLSACMDHLRGSNPAAWYRGFLAFWIATAATIPEDVDLIVDSGALARSRSYRKRCAMELARLTGRMVDFDDANDGGDGMSGGPDAPRLRCSEVLGAHAGAEAFLSEQAGAEWADTRVLGHVARLLAEARSNALGARPAPVFEARPVPDPDFDSTLLSARARASWAERELATMLGSRSWRITAPLRWLRQTLG